MPAQYGIHTSDTKSMLLIEYSVEQLVGHCVANYDRYSSVTLMQRQLNWQNLQQCQKIATRQLLLNKALYDHIALQVPSYFTLSHSIPE